MCSIPNPAAVCRAARNVPTLCPGRLAGAVVAFGLMADRMGSTVSPTFRVFGWVAISSDSAEGRAMNASRVIKSNAVFFNAGTWAGRIWHHRTISARGDDLPVSVGSALPPGRAKSARQCDAVSGPYGSRIPKARVLAQIAERQHEIIPHSPPDWGRAVRDGAIHSGLAACRLRMNVPTIGIIHAGPGSLTRRSGEGRTQGPVLLRRGTRGYRARRNEKKSCLCASSLSRQRYSVSPATTRSQPSRSRNALCSYEWR